MNESIISSANLHRLGVDEVNVNAVNNTVWANLGPVAVFGQGISKKEALSHLRGVFDKVLTDIDLMIAEEQHDAANDTALPSE